MLYTAFRKIERADWSNGMVVVNRFDHYLFSQGHPAACPTPTSKMRVTIIPNQFESITRLDSHTDTHLRLPPSPPPCAQFTDCSWNSQRAAALASPSCLLSACAQVALGRLVTSLKLSTFASSTASSHSVRVVFLGGGGGGEGGAGGRASSCRSMSRHASTVFPSAVAITMRPVWWPLRWRTLREEFTG